MTRSSALSDQSKHAARNRGTRTSGESAIASRSADLAANWPTDVVNTLKAAAARIRPAASAGRLWHRLTAAERRQLGDDFDAAFSDLGTVGIWMRARGGTAIPAIVGAAREIGFLTSADCEWLLRETIHLSGQESGGNAGEPTADCGAGPPRVPSRPTATPAIEKPVWHPETGVLGWRNRELARFRLNRGDATLVEKIVNSFADAKWATRIKNPLTDLPREKVTQAIYYLNEKVSPLRLHLEGRFLSWELRKE